jgi:hypothetical protein
MFPNKKFETSSHVTQSLHKVYNHLFVFVFTIFLLLRKVAKNPSKCIHFCNDELTGTFFKNFFLQNK